MPWKKPSAKPSVCLSKIISTTAWNTPSKHSRQASAHHSKISSKSPSTSRPLPMSSFAELLQQGASQAWLYFPSAILLGALHGLEPGHSKTMMAAFIVAIRGTVKQAVLLGLAATLSHTAVVWLVAMAGMYLGQNLDAETTEPYFQLASAAIIITIALWMLWRTWRGEQMWRFEEGMSISTTITMMKRTASIPGTDVSNFRFSKKAFPRAGD